MTVRDYSCRQQSRIQFGFGAGKFSIGKCLPYRNINHVYCQWRLDGSRSQRNGGTVDFSSSISTRAITCAADSAASFLVVGGEVSSNNFVIEVFSVEDPNSPQRIQQVDVSGRLTSVATKNGFVAYSTDDGTVGSFAVGSSPTSPARSMSTVASCSLILIVVLAAI